MTTILKGDCLQVMKGMADKSIDCFICDLPFGCLTGGASWDVKINLDEFWTQIKRLAKNDHTPILMFCNTRYGYDLIKSNESWFRYDIVWAKTNAVGFLRANKAPMTSHEMIYVFSKKGAFYKRIDIEGDFKRNGGGRSCSNFLPIGDLPNTSNVDNTGKRCVKSVVTFTNGKTKGGHPTAKPVELYEWLLKRYVPENGTMLDPTAGSFNSVFTAKALGIKAVGIEKNDEYFNKAIKKLLTV
jgi:site-specific DNA-methyltransferase (adenine-specific)